MSRSPVSISDITWDQQQEQQFAATVLPHLRRRDQSGLADELRAAWPAEQLAVLLKSENDDTVKLAAVCLGVIGTMAHCPALAGALRHADSVVVSMAEHALWRVWLHAGPPEASAQVQQAACLIARSRCRQAICLLDDVIGTHPDLAEAHNQRGTAHYLNDGYLEAIADYRRAVVLNPTHFAALAGLGHSFSGLGEYGRALEAYCSALNIHPRMDGIRNAIQQTRSMLQGPNL